jgi:hypothetical protein
MAVNNWDENSSEHRGEYWREMMIFAAKDSAYGIVRIIKYRGSTQK